jgi:hypothetical protein
MFALGCTLFFLCTGRELYGAGGGGGGGGDPGARTKTKASEHVAWRRVKRSTMDSQPEIPNAKPKSQSPKPKT